MKLFIQQRGRCAVSNIPFPMNGDKHWVISIDRLSNDIGYVKGNVQLVCKAFNVNAGFTTQKFQAAYTDLTHKYSFQ